MAEVINLRRFRKAAARAAGAASAARNRIAFGRPLVERLALETERTRAERRLDGHRLSVTAEDPDPDKPRG